MSSSTYIGDCGLHNITLIFKLFIFKSPNNNSHKIHPNNPSPTKHTNRYKPFIYGLFTLWLSHHIIHKKHIKPSSYIAEFPYQLKEYKKYFLFSDHFSRNTVLFSLVYIMFFRTHLKIQLFRYKYSLFSYLFHIVYIQKTL